MATDNRTFIAHPLLRARDWQHREQLDRVCQWWRDGGSGVCALIGIGGAGKTAIADRFLQVLPGVLPVDAATPKDDSLPTPNSTFVFSFYDAPNPEAFFEALDDWLRATLPPTIFLVSDGRTSYHQIVVYLQNAPPALLILDGLEKIQQDGTRGGIFGRIADGNLRDFVTRLAQGFLPRLGALITSRFSLADLDEVSPTYYRPISVEEIDVATGIDLLRRRGVRGGDEALKAIVEKCGRHALTVDMAGGFLCEFHKGDPTTNLSIGSPEEIEQAASREHDPRRRAVLKQELRFAKVAGRYRAALQQKDAAALALLERVCLFRLGVDAETLTAIFTGKGSQKAAGRALSRLNAKRLQQKLDLLVRMNLLEPSGSSSSLSTLDSGLSTLYSIHPAVREGFLSGIADEDRIVGHEAAREGLTAALGERPGENPSDPATLDLLEEIVHHTLQSGHVSEAWDIYGNRMGQYENLGWRLGAYERGERICRAFAGGRSPEGLADLLDNQPQGASPRFAQQPAASAVRLIPPFVELPEARQANFINEWALYLQALGRLAAAARCYELDIEMRMRQENWKNASIGNQNLCEVWLLSGRLKGEERSEKSETVPSSFTLHTSPFDEALRLAELADDPEERLKSHAYRAHARGLRGEVPAALADFRAALDWQHKRETHAPDRPLYSNRGIRHTHLLARLGRREEATQLTEANQELMQEGQGTSHSIPKCQLVLSSLHIESGDLSSAERLWSSARDWALARDAKEVLCWAALVRARLELARSFNRVPNGPRDSDNSGISSSSTRGPDPLSCVPGTRLNEVETALAEGLKIARDCGYGLYHIDLLLERARLHLLRGNASAALDDVALALDTGIPADAATGQPELLAANHEACGYAWAIPTGLQLRAEALLLQAAHLLGRTELHSVNDIQDGVQLRPTEDEVPADVTQLIDQAKQFLNEALDRWHDLRDPEPTEDNNFQLDGKEYNYRAAETHQVLVNLEGGMLTQYRLTPKQDDDGEVSIVTEDESGEEGQTNQAAEGSRRMTKKHVFLSYCRDNKDEVSNLRDDLIAAGEQVWWDQDILGGHDWKLEIRKAMRDAYAVVVCFSEATADRITSGVYPEVLDAISAYREYAPGGIFLIPVRLSECDIPLIEIDGTRTLDRLNYVDLFEAGGIDKLVQSIEASALHP